MTHRRFLVASALAAVAAVTLAPATASAASEPEQSGSIIVGAGMGPQFFLSPAGAGAGFNLNFTGGYAFSDHLYGLFQPNFVFGAAGGAVIALPLGLQYDVAIEKVPGLYVYPRFSVGPAFYTGGGNAAFLLVPEAGVKYNIQEKFFVGFEPFSLPIGISSTTFVGYRINFNAGLYL